MKVRKGDVVVFNGLKDATKFEVLDAKGFEVCVKQAGTDYCPQYVDLDQIHSIVKDR
jgi:hypothetical protein